MSIFDDIAGLLKRSDETTARRKAGQLIRQLHADGDLSQASRKSLAAALDDLGLGVEYVRECLAVLTQADALARAAADEPAAREALDALGRLQSQALYETDAIRIQQMRLECQTRMPQVLAAQDRHLAASRARTALAILKAEWPHLF